MTWSTAMPQPEIAIPVWPVATNTLRSPRARAARSSSRVTVILPIAQSEPTDSTTRSDGSRLYGPSGVSRSPGPTRRSISCRPRCEAIATSSGSSASTLWRPASTSIPRPIASPRAARHSAESLPPSGATPISSRLAPSAAASATDATIGTGRAQYGTTSSAVRPALTESTTATMSRGAYRITPWPVLPFRVSNWPSAKIASFSLIRCPRAGSRTACTTGCKVARAARSVASSYRRHPDPGLLGQHHPAVGEPETAERAVGDQQVPVEVDPVDERRHLQRLSDPELRLDHAAEHDAEAERARRVRHAHRLADAAALRELDVDAVRVGCDRRHAREVLAPLVDHDGDPLPQLAQRVVAREVVGREGLLHELDAELDQRRHQLARRLERPALVAVDAQRRVRRAADHLEPREVVGAAHLDQIGRAHV